MKFKRKRPRKGGSGDAKYQMARYIEVSSDIYATYLQYILQIVEKRLHLDDIYGIEGEELDG